MKYTEKFGKGYLTYEGKDLKKYAPSSLFEVVWMTIGTVLLFFVFFGLFVLACTVGGWILEFLFCIILGLD